MFTIVTVFFFATYRLQLSVWHHYQTYLYRDELFVKVHFVELTSLMGLPVKQMGNLFERKDFWKISQNTVLHTTCWEMLHRVITPQPAAPAAFAFVKMMPHTYLSDKYAYSLPCFDGCFEHSFADSFFELSAYEERFSILLNF